ncbi:helix-turn-helix transcriptional regulator [bacterium]|nr:helix-turn-helix transcriptional regulator [bacterium]
MTHLPVIITLFALLIGTVAIVISVQYACRENRRHYLKYLSRYLLLFNLMLLMSWLAQYSCVNILGSCPALSSTQASKWLHLLGTLLSVFMQQAIFILTASVFCFRFTAKLDRWSLIFALIIYIIAILPAFFGREFSVLSAFTMSAYFWLVHVGVFGFLIISLLRKTVVNRIKPLILIGGYLLIICSIVWGHSLTQVFRDMVMALTGVLINALILFWILKIDSSVTAIQETESSGDLSGLSSYGLSPREIDIALLVLAGRSNKEIEFELHISHHTVKNHLYRMYKKVGVNSRAQFMHLTHAGIEN